MTSSLVITLVVLAAIGWLAFLAVSALRSRGPEEVPANLAPGGSDDILETRTLERAQQAAVLLSAFLAIGLPLYYLSENDRQEGFVEQFDEESVTRGEHLVTEFACYGCHGPEGVGGVASYVEKRTGVTVSWSAPPLNDVFSRYGREEVRYWLTYGRGNSPMPAWGVEGGGPMNPAQIEDIINYLETAQIPQAAAASDVDQRIALALDELAQADEAMDATIVRQRELIAKLRRAPELAPIMTQIRDRADVISESVGVGIDSDGDGLSDAAELAISDITQEAKVALLLPGLEEITLDPANPATNGTPDLQVVESTLEAMRALVDSERAPILIGNIRAIEASLAAGGEDGDGDGLPDTAEAQIPAQVTAAIDEVLPSDLRVVTLDPSNEATVGGEPDADTARRAISGIDTIALNLNVQANNLDSLLPPAVDALDNLVRAQQERAWEFDLEAIADGAFDGNVDKAQRVVGIFNAYCARCHTSGRSAGIPFAQEAGSGGFGPALWDGRPAVQFLSDESLKDFLIAGAEANKAYGVNGFGNGQMPAFGETLSEPDLLDLAHWLRLGNLTGKDGS